MASVTKSPFTTRCFELFFSPNTYHPLHEEDEGAVPTVSSQNEQRVAQAWDQINKDPLSIIAGFLDEPDLARAAQTCRVWKETVKERSLCRERLSAFYQTSCKTKRERRCAFQYLQSLRWKSWIEKNPFMIVNGQIWVFV